MPYRVHTVSTLTWGDRVEVDAATASWARSMNSGESGSASFRVGDPAVAETATQANLEPRQRALCVSWTDGDTSTLVYVGTITQLEYDHSSQTVTARTTDAAWDLLAGRLLLGSRSASDMAKSKLTFNNFTLASQAKKVIDAAVSPSPADKYGAPFEIASYANGSEDRTYYGYDLTTALDALEALMDTDGGPDVDLRPYWGPGGVVRWEVRVGNLATTRGVEFDFTASDSGARDLKATYDAEEHANFIVGTGEGSEVDKLVRTSSSVASSAYPARERVDNFSDVKKGTELQGLTTAARRAADVATYQVGFDMQADGPVHTAAELTLGMPVRWNVASDPFMANIGYRQWQCIRFSGDLGDWIKLEFQERTS